MYGNDNPNQENVDCDKNQTTEDRTQQAGIFNVLIPKVEPYSPDTPDTNEDTFYDGELMVSPIPFTTPYKIRDPIVLIEKCDKIWETLKLIKNVQSNRASHDTFDALSSEITNSESYIKYQPVLGNNNAALPNFQLSVKTTRRLFHCSICGKQYMENRALRHHSERIHGVHIPPKRINSNLTVRKNIDADKESSEVEKEKSSREKPYSKRNENKQPTDALAQSVLSQVIGNNTPNSLPHKGTRSISTRVSNNFSASETITNEQEREISKNDLKQNEKSDFPCHDSVPVQCILCKKLVKDIKRHLTDYHKIQSPDFMLKEIEKTTATSQNKELEKVCVSNESSHKNEEKRYKNQRKRKRKSSLSPRKRHIIPQDAQAQNSITHQNETRQCEICLGVYGRNSFPRHARTHSLRGETKENFHLCNRKYKNSPLLKGRNAKNSCNTTTEDTNNCTNSNENVQMKMVQNSNRKKSRSPLKNNGKLETICSCGRSFRNPHTLFIHKGKCDLENIKRRQSTRKVKLNASVDSASGNSCDRDSGIGISITIKKKNNSYEVIGNNNNNNNNNSNNNNNESELQDLRYLKGKDTSSDISNEFSQTDSHMNQKNEIPELSKYSENHRILKLQLVEEDMDVDIEEDSQSSLCNNNIDERFNNSFKQHQELETEQENVSINETGKINKDRNCVCGRRFSTEQSLQVHIDEHHRTSQLTCGYCKTTFSDITAWRKHNCSIQQGRIFVDLPMQIHCPYCSTIINSYKTFDNHIMISHFDPLVPYQCVQCPERFPHSWSRRIHYKETHGVPFCPVCKLQCPDIIKPRHDAYHYGLGFPCHICKKAYASLFSLVSHRSKVHPRIQECKSLKSLYDFNLPEGNGKYAMTTRNTRKNIEFGS